MPGDGPSTVTMDHLVQPWQLDVLRTDAGRLAVRMSANADVVPQGTDVRSDGRGIAVRSRDVGEPQWERPLGRAYDLAFLEDVLANWWLAGGGAPALVAGNGDGGVAEQPTFESPVFAGVLPRTIATAGSVPVGLHEVWVSVDAMPQLLGLEPATLPDGAPTVRARVLLPAVDLYLTNPGHLPAEFWPYAPESSTDVGVPYIRIKASIEVLTSGLFSANGTSDTRDFRMAESRYVSLDDPSLGSARGDGITALAPGASPVGAEVVRFEVATDQWDAYWAQHDSALIASPELEGLGVDVEAAIENGALWLATRLAAEAFVQVDLPARRVGWRTSSFEGAGLPGTQVVLQRLRQDASAENADAQIDGRGSYIEVSGGVDVRVSGSPGETRGLANWLREQTVPGCVEGELPLVVLEPDLCSLLPAAERLDDTSRAESWAQHRLRQLALTDRVSQCVGGVR